MNRVNDLYRCNVCGQQVRVVRPGPGALYCCGEPMELIEEDDEEGTEESS